MTVQPVVRRGMAPRANISRADGRRVHRRQRPGVRGRAAYEYVREDAEGAILIRYCKCNEYDYDYYTGYYGNWATVHRIAGLYRSVYTAVRP